MVKLYIANCTKHNQDFLFKLPDQKTINNYRAQIPIGAQTLILQKDIEQTVANFIVDQYRKYGIVAVSELDRTKGFAGLCYQFDKPIDVERIMQAMTHNEEAMELKGHEQRKLQAAALSNSIDQNLQGSDSTLQGIEVEVFEQPKAGNNDPKMVETIQVAKPGSKAAARGARKAEEQRGR